MTIEAGAAGRIREAMARKGWSQAQLAKAVKVSAPTVSNWLSSTHGAKWENVRLVARELGVSPSWIMFGGDEEAERTVQTAAELELLRRFRELDDREQIIALRMINSLRELATSSR